MIQTFENNKNFFLLCPSSDACIVFYHTQEQDSRSLMKQVLNLVPDHVVTVDLKESGVPLKEALSAGDTPYAAVLVTATG